MVFCPNSTRRLQAKKLGFQPKPSSPFSQTTELYFRKASLHSGILESRAPGPQKVPSSKIISFPSRFLRFSRACPRSSTLGPPLVDRLVDPTPPWHNSSESHLSYRTHLSSPIIFFPFFPICPRVEKHTHTQYLFAAPNSQVSPVPQVLP